MTREIIIAELTNRGYHVFPEDVTKNGVVRHGIIFKSGKICPVIYVDDFLEMNDIPRALAEIIRIYEENKIETPVNVADYFKWEYAQRNVQLCLQKKGEEELIKRNFLDLEQYVALSISSENISPDLTGYEGRIKIKPEHLDLLGVTESEMFEAAYKNTQESADIQDMFQLLASMGLPIERSDTEDDPLMITASNKSKSHGASVMCITNALAEVADRYKSDLYIIPSSVHEIILVPLKGNEDKKSFDTIIQEVNNSLSPEEVLSDHVYKFVYGENRITY